MDKQAIVKSLQEKIQEQRDALQRSIEVAHGDSVHSESRQENKYDTRGLEASYLADAQTKRLVELESVHAYFRGVELEKFGAESAIGLTALVCLVEGEKESFYLLMQKGGGLWVEHKGTKVRVITPQSPVGTALMGKCPGDFVEIAVGPNLREFEIKVVF